VLCVECAPTEEIIRTIIKPYDYGLAPVLVLNCMKNQDVGIKQHGEKYEIIIVIIKGFNKFFKYFCLSENAVFIMPDQYFMKTWNNPIGKRELNWSCGNLTDQIYNLDIMVKA